MSLPNSRPRTYVPGMPLVPDDVNELFDANIDGKMKERWQWQTPSRAVTETNVAFVPGVGFEGDVWKASAAAAVLSGIPVYGLAVGDRITSIGLKLQGTGLAGTSRLYLMRSSGVGGHDPIETLEIVDPPATWETYTKALAAPHTVADGEAFYWTVNLALINTQASNMGHAKERP